MRPSAAGQPDQAHRSQQKLYAVQLMLPSISMSLFYGCCVQADAHKSSLVNCVEA